MNVNMINRKSASNVDVAFIIINYNTKDLLEDLLNFLAFSELPFTYTLVVVDNNSSDGSVEFLAKREDVFVIQNRKNIGYGRAANKGVEASDSRYVCILNTDLILNTEALTAVWHYLENNPRVGVCSPVLCYPNGRIQGFFFKFNILILYSDLINKLYSKSKKIYIGLAKSPVRVDGVTGAFIFLRRSFVADTKLFDEDYFFYYEDTDLAHRWKNKNLVCMVLPQYKIVHLGGQSSSVKNAIIFYHSKYIYIKKHWGDNHYRMIYKLDYVKIRIKIIFYNLINAVYPTLKYKYKLTYYQTVITNIDMIWNRYR